MQDLLVDLNEPQRRAVTHVDGPLLVLAGAGSGKTRVITRRVAWLIQQGAAPWNILAITFTNKAAGEMLQRVEALRAPPGATICTFHSLCARLLREFAAEAGLEPNYSIYDRDDQVRIVRQALKDLGASAERLQPARVHAAISNAKNELKTADAFAADAGDDAYRHLLADVYRRYEHLLASNNALDFDDLLLRMAFLLGGRADVRELLGHRYRYILIDEYQDTNRAQYMLAHSIAAEHHNLCVTGDPDQSIYAWRGADIRNILKFEADYGDAVVIRLEENYRSTGPILAAASSLIAHNTMRKAKTLWTRRPGGEKVRVVFCEDEHAEAAEIVRRALARLAAGGRLDDVAVFYRVNALSRVLEDAFRKAGLAYRIARGVEFYNRKEIKDALAYLRLLVNPADDLSCARIINTPARGIGGVTVGRLAAAAEAHGRSLLEACSHPGEAGLKSGAAKKVADFAELMGSLGKELDRPVREVVETVLVRGGLEESLRESSEDSRQALANLAELVTTASEFDRDNEQARLADFLHQIALVSDVDHFEGATGAVTFMTLHAAKGLEFSAVFVVGCENGLLPMQRMDAPDPAGGRKVLEALEEERRLAFVGMTRAKDELTLSCARTRLIRGSRLSQAASRFLSEIDPDSTIVEDTTLAAPRTSRPGTRGRGGFFEDVQERAAIEAAMDAALGPIIDANDPTSGLDVEPPPIEYEHLRTGSRIRHPKFGRGKVVALRNPWPETRAEIVFDESGHKTIYLKHTRVEVIEERE